MAHSGSMSSVHHLIACLVGLTLSTSWSAQAIDLQPGEVRPLPPGTRIVQTSLLSMSLDGSFSDGQKQPGEREVTTTLSLLRLGYYFEIADLPAVAYVQGAAGETDLGGLLAPIKGDSGFDDTVFLLAIWPYADNSSRTYWGIGAYLFVPTGSYDNELGLFSVGKNRYAAALQTGFQAALDSNFIIMTAFDATWFGSNDDFTVDHLKLEQRPLATAQAALTYQLTPEYSLSGGYFYTFGGEYVLEGVAQDNANSTHRYQVSAAAQYPIGRFTMQYGGDLKRENGLFEDRRLIFRYNRAF